MVAENVAAVVNLAVVEVLVNPDFGDAWITDLLTSEGVEATDEVVNQTSAAVDALLRELAAPFVARLPENIRGYYTK